MGFPFDPVGAGLVYNAKSYGAFGDGVHDDTAAWQSAANAAGKVGGGTVYGIGDFLVSSPIVVPTAVNIIGAGIATNFRPNATMAAIFQTSGNDNIFRDFWMEGLSSTYTNNPAADGIQLLGGASRVRIANVTAFYLNGWGVRSVPTTSAAIFDTKIDHLYVQRGAGGISLAGAAPSDDSVSTWIADCFLGTVMENEALLLTDCTDVQVNGLYAVSQGTKPCIHLVGLTEAVFFRGLDAGGVSAAAFAQPVVAFDSDTNGSPGQIQFHGGIVQLTSGNVIQVAAAATDHLILFDGLVIMQGSSNAFAQTNNGAWPIKFQNCEFPDTNYTIFIPSTNAIGFDGGYSGRYGPLTGSAPAYGFKNVKGINPAGSTVPGTAFSLPASGTAWTNNTGVDGTLFVTGAGVVTDVVVQGVTVASSLSVGQSYFVPAGGTITLTYTTAPTLVFVGN